MNLADVLGTVAGVLTTLAFAPQVWTVWKTRSTREEATKRAEEVATAIHGQKAAGLTLTGADRDSYSRSLEVLKPFAVTLHDAVDAVAAVQVGRATLGLIKQNLYWAFGYNTLAIPLGMGILYPFTHQMVSPELAALLMATSSLSVTLNTLRMRNFVPAIRWKGTPSPYPLPVGERS